jgi:hypothetical protein
VKFVVVIRFSVFHDKIRDGMKTQTIRPIDTYRHIRLGDLIHCYSTKKVEGVRRPVLHELLRKGFCEEIIIARFGDFKDNEDIAVRDGFVNAESMEFWFNAKYPDITDDMLFRIIRWKANIVTSRDWSKKMFPYSLTEDRNRVGKRMM